MHTSSHGRLYFSPGPKRLRVHRVRSRTAAESVFCDLGVNQSLSQPTKYISLTVHKAPELTKLQAASYVGVRYTWPLELAHEAELRWKIISFVEVESLCGATGYPLRTPRLKDTVLDAHTREPITVFTQRYLGVLRLCRWSQPGYNQKSALFISEIRVERSHSMFCTICHIIDITTGYCSWVEIHPYQKSNGIWYASQTPDIQLCLLLQQTGILIIGDDLYLCIELVSTATTSL